MALSWFRRMGSSVRARASEPQVRYHSGMLSRLRTTLSLVIATAFAAASLVAAPQAPAAGQDTSAASVASYALSQSMPVDPEVAVGTLPNGLRYYVRPNGKPAHRAELRLVVKAGSVLEDDDQQG